MFDTPKHKIQSFTKKLQILGESSHHFQHIKFKNYNTLIICNKNFLSRMYIQFS